jgi:hypothetical protein
VKDRFVPVLGLALLLPGQGCVAPAEPTAETVQERSLEDLEREYQAGRISRDDYLERKRDIEQREVTP